MAGHKTSVVIYVTLVRIALGYLYIIMKSVYNYLKVLWISVLRRPTQATAWLHTFQLGRHHILSVVFRNIFNNIGG